MIVSFSNMSTNCYCCFSFFLDEKFWKLVKVKAQNYKMKFEQVPDRGHVTTYVLRSASFTEIVARDQSMRSGTTKSYGGGKPGKDRTPDWAAWKKKQETGSLKGLACNMFCDFIQPYIY